MTDIIVSPLPRYLNQFAASSFDEHPSLFRCGTASGAMAVDFHYPGKYNLYQVEHDEYTKLVGPDTPQDTNGVTNEKMMQFFKDMQVPVIDLQNLVDIGLNTGNYQPFYDEVEAQNKQGIIQFMSVADESLLINSATGISLHPNLHYGHCIVRLGFSTDMGYAYYWDPAAPQACTRGNAYVPVQISWAESIVKARPNFCMAIMPPNVSLPPASFSFQHGVWPAPVKAGPDLVKLASNLDSMSSTMAQMQTFLNNLSAEIKAAQGEV